MARTLKSTWATIEGHKGGKEVESLSYLTSSHGLIDRMATREDKDLKWKWKNVSLMSVLNNNNLLQQIKEVTEMWSII